MSRSRLCSAPTRQRQAALVTGQQAALVLRGFAEIPFDHDRRDNPGGCRAEPPGPQRRHVSNGTKGQQHVFYVAADGNVHHTYWDPASGIHADQWTSDGQAGTELATLLSG